MQGLIDLHVHCAPDVFDRSVDDHDAARLYRARGMEAFALKSHTLVTADRAWLARRHVEGIRAYGGVTLNSAVGGLNPDAVEWMVRIQGGLGRMVWFPTFDAEHHARHFGNGPGGIPVVDGEGEVLRLVRDRPVEGLPLLLGRGPVDGQDRCGNSWMRQGDGRSLEQRQVVGAAADVARDRPEQAGQQRGGRRSELVSHCAVNPGWDSALPRVYSGT